MLKSTNICRSLCITGPNDQYESEPLLYLARERPINLMLGPVILTGHRISFNFNLPL